MNQMKARRIADLRGASLIKRPFEVGNNIRLEVKVLRMIPLRQEVDEKFEAEGFQDVLWLSKLGIRTGFYNDSL